MTTAQITDKLHGMRTRLFSTDEFARLIESGILAEDERVELLKGELISMTPIGPRHVECINRLNLLLAPLMAARSVIVSIQNPIHLDDYSQPQPDLVLARYRPDIYQGTLPSPSDILLLIEVADSSEEYDRKEKLPLYARAGIPETWLINLNQNTIEAHRTPSQVGYRDAHTYWGEEQLSPAAIPEFTLAVNDLFPPQ